MVRVLKLCWPATVLGCHSCYNLRPDGEGTETNPDSIESPSTGTRYNLRPDGEGTETWWPRCRIGHVGPSVTTYDPMVRVLKHIVAACDPLVFGGGYNLRPDGEGTETFEGVRLGSKHLRYNLRPDGEGTETGAVNQDVGRPNRLQPTTRW